MAKELGIDEATVRSRLRKWESSGFLVYWGATVNQALVGQHRCLVRFEVADVSRKDEVLDKLRLVEGVYRIRDYVGGVVAVSIFFDSQTILDKRIKLVHALAHAQGSFQVEIEGLPQPQAELDETDLLILGAVGWSARKPNVSVAHETGLSAKTVRRRLEKMQENHTIGMGLFLDYRRLAAVLVADLLIVHVRSEKENINRKIQTMVGERMLPPSFSTPRAGGFRLMLTNISEQRDILRVVSRLEGIRYAWLDVLVEDVLVAETYYAMERLVLEKVAAKRPLRPITHQVWEESWKLPTNGVYPRTQT
jgi:DNA-binding Lrp family transcriptional regulator